MLQLKTVYTLASTPAILTEWAIRADWIPEIEDLEWKLTHEVLEALQAAGRLTVQSLVNEYIDHRRSATLNTVWFDGKPVMIVQNAGRSGDDHSRRWVTDSATYVELCAYLRSLLALDVEKKDVADPDSFIYEEEIFSFYGHEFAAKFGYATEPVTPGYDLYGDDDVREFLPEGPKDLILAAVREGLALPTYLRRGNCVMKKERAVVDEDLASNPKIKEICAADGFTQLYWYRECPRPTDEPVLSV